MKVAIVHDWINGMRGGEKCLATFLQIYPKADIYTLLHEPGKTSVAIDHAVKATSCMQKTNFTRKFYRWLLPLYPLAINKLKLLDDYDLVISTSHAAAKNVKVNNKAVHVCYCFTPMRYIWDQVKNYLGLLRIPSWPLIKLLRFWDKQGSKRVDHFIAISKMVAARIRCFYGRKSEIIYPAVSIDHIPFRSGSRSDLPFLVAGALVPYKRVDLAIKAFNKLNVPLVIAGAGPELKKLQSMAGKNITLLGFVSDTKLAELYSSSRALVFPGKEDFGMVPIEAQAGGCPVIAYSAGGVLDTVNGVSVNNPQTNSLKGALTGVYFTKQDVQSLIDAINFFISIERQIKAEDCLAKSKQFSVARFRESWYKFMLDRQLTHLL